MLVLSRKVGQRILIGDDIELVVSRISGHRVTLGLAAPKGVHIRRGELAPLDEAAEADEPADATASPAVPSDSSLTLDIPIDATTA